MLKRNNNLKLMLSGSHSNAIDHAKDIAETYTTNAEPALAKISITIEEKDYSQY